MSPDTPTLIGLGLDAGGTQTRWAMDGAEGQAATISGLQLGSTEGRAHIAATLADIAAATGPVQRVVAGVTGLDSAQQAQLAGMVAAAFKLPAEAVQAMSDIELACLAAFAPGEGYVVYAGTGSIAAFLDTAGALHRVGGRGAVIDDAGGGHWIACQALRLIWRAEDEAPGAWQASPLARRLFEQIGGSDWARTRQWVYGATRGELGTLALAVAAAADEDPAALALLQQAGVELARLARVLLQRHGPRSLALAGRVFDLHPAVENGLRSALSEAAPGCDLRRQTLSAHHTAARLAAGHRKPP